MHIDKNIPLPKAKAGKKSKPRFFDDMEVGDSVFFEDRVMAYRLRGSLHNSGMRPAIREVDGGFRVWRMK
ncbi:hypothetical protein N9M50_07655 [Alphaproteobacteria bacterium]|nr:hypothetical protein [Alphaproteobacteria bacterium]